MSNNVPKSTLGELTLRWELAKLRLAVFEGPNDVAFMAALADEPHADPVLAEIDCWPVEAVEIPHDLLVDSDIVGTGSKQDVIAFCRAAERLGHQAGFRGIVDRDLDGTLGIDWASECLLYTDYSCMDAYAWSAEALRRLLRQYDCSSVICSPAAAEKLFQGINRVCLAIAGFRLTVVMHPALQLAIHRSTKSLSLEGDELTIDIRKYVQHAPYANGKLEEAMSIVLANIAMLDGTDPFDVLNSHDLDWLVLYVLREKSGLTRRMVEENVVRRSTRMHGIADPEIWSRPLLQKLIGWARH